MTTGMNIGGNRVAYLSVGAGRDGARMSRSERASPFCARGALPASMAGRSTSSLGATG
jgi:hypothetical protein